MAEGVHVLVVPLEPLDEGVSIRKDCHEEDEITLNITPPSPGGIVTFVFLHHSSTS
jgi:hypothetical protein